MPLEIRELHIKATLSDDESANNSLSQNNEDPRNNIRTQNLINRAVEKVLEILKEKNER